MDARKRLNRKRQDKKPAAGRFFVKKGKGAATGKASKSATPSKKGAGKAFKGNKNVSQPTKTLTRKISDLRQIISTRRPVVSKQTISQKKSAIKKRLGLQSKSARERVQQAGNEQRRGNQGTRPNRPQTKNRSVSSVSHPAAPTIIIAQTPASSEPAVLTSGATRASGYSVVVSNLNPAVTQSDVLELFGDVGTVTSYQSINSTTAMVTFSHPQQASAAVQTYNNRLLDGQPMLVTLIPAPAAPQAKRAAQAFRRVFRS